MTEQIRPRSLRLETATVCQLKCPTCPTTQGITRENLGGGFLKLKEFQKLVDENPWIAHIELSNWGEIFLNPEIYDIMECAYRKSVVLTASNGANLNTVKEKVLEGLVKFKFRHITCSIDGASQETYSIYRVGGNFERVIENIKIINHYKEKYQSLFPLLRWQFVAFGHNEHEIETARKLAESLNMKFWLKLNVYEEFSPVKNEELIRKESGLGVASRSEYYEKYGTGYLQDIICRQLWLKPQINWDGRILGCCYNYWGDFGNAFESGLQDGLNGDKINYARQMLLGKVEAKEGIPCTTCDRYKAMQKNGSWLKESDVTAKTPPLKKMAYGLAESLGMGRVGVWLTNRSQFLAKRYAEEKNNW